MVDYLVSAQRLMTKYMTDVNHVRHVEALAERLFRELQPVHGLEQKYLLELKLAACLHDIGHYVGEKKHHLHSCYLILSDDGLASWDEGIRSRVAYAALNHRKKRRLVWSGAGTGDPAKCDALAGLLRIADVLDYEHNQLVRINGIRYNRKERLVVLELEGIALSSRAKKFNNKLGWAAACWNMDIVLDNGIERIVVPRQS